MSLSTQSVWAALVAETKKIGAFKDVRALPINRVNNEEFLRTFPDLNLPACLIVMTSGEDAADGAARDRLRHWAAVIVAADPVGDAWQQACDLLDAFCDGEFHVLDKQIMGGQLTIYGTSDFTVPFCNERRSVIDLAFTTKQVDRR